MSIEDRNTRKFVLETRDKQIIFQFEDHGAYVFDPPTAVRIAQSILDAAKDCGFEITLQVPGQEHGRRHVSSMQRQAMIVRATHIMRSMAGKDFAKVSVQLVDTFLAQVL